MNFFIPKCKEIKIKPGIWVPGFIFSTFFVHLHPKKREVTMYKGLFHQIVSLLSAPGEAWDKIKAKHPDAIQFVRTGDNYTAYNEDAVKITETLALKMEKHEADMKKGFTASVTFPVSQLDTFLQKLARSGARVVIRDAEGLADARNRTTGITERTAGNGQTRTLFDTAQEKQSERRIEPEENEQRSSMRR